jgi:hypothetical protein
MAIPDKKLVGKNASLDNGVYSDDYMVALNQFVTVNETLKDLERDYRREDYRKKKGKK